MSSKPRATASNVSVSGSPSISLENLARDMRRLQAQIVDERAAEEARQWLSRWADNVPLPVDPARRDQALHELIGICIRGRLQSLLSAYRIPHPSYNYFVDFEENMSGPWDALPRTWQASTPAVWSVLGFDVGFPIGVPASVLTSTPKWIEYYARLGYNILTYKSVRSEQRPALPGINWLFLDELDSPLPVGETLPIAHGDEAVWPNHPKAFSMANSFGIPSPTPEVWQQDIAQSLASLRSDQLLIVSVTGTPEKYVGEDLVADFVRTAAWAEEAGALAIELNLSCPNTVDSATNAVKTEMICQSPADTAAIVHAVRRKLKHAKLVVKFSYMKLEQLRAVIAPLAQEGMIDGVSGINTLQMEIRHPGLDDRPAFVGTPNDKNQPRWKAGVSGIAIRNFGLDFVHSLATIRRDHHLNFDIIGMGGVMTTDDIDAYQRAGANAVQTATTAFFDPTFAQQVVVSLFGSAPTLEVELGVRSKLLQLVQREPMTLTQLSSEVKGLVGESEQVQEFFDHGRLIAEKTRGVLQRLEEEGVVAASREDGSVVWRATSPTAY